MMGSLVFASLACGLLVTADDPAPKAGQDALKGDWKQTAFVHRPLENGPGKGSPMPAAGRFDFLAKDFLELATALGV